MAVPKRIKSKSKTRMRKANWKLSGPNLVECPQCHEMVLGHRVCSSCGYYGGKSIVNVSNR